MCTALTDAANSGQGHQMQSPWTKNDMGTSQEDMGQEETSMEVTDHGGCTDRSRHTKHRRHYAERLWRIIISESAFLIWKLRCERVIGHSEEEGWKHSKTAIRGRWTHMINDRLHKEMDMTHRRFGRKALKRETVLGTWNGTLSDELALPEDWTACRGVLVGINTARTERDAG
ncbi:uncharacterized protein C8Q71DRAFT_68123 [Rhodofomes roseus]|uniref:Uncharacterized protein n=1 Tax=Rhodofomes roseus TaxID=34475 RepID=A0ABQ8KF46_9APHY|nr:uncharacterized protein C8Q71DRAFT_68123 [Rhodofomes roseus]KAH9836135.1 hypothetical protein C8Q71DRAFT_68123 [Rhodofomes roseus]